MKLSNGASELGTWKNIEFFERWKKVYVLVSFARWEAPKKNRFVRVCACTHNACAWLLMELVEFYYITIWENVKATTCVNYTCVCVRIRVPACVELCECEC